MAAVKAGIPYRQFQALETKRRIAATARRLFALNGYASTSMESIAEEAGVAERTVYLAFGNKMAILGAIAEQWHEQSKVLTLYKQAMNKTDAAAALQLIAHATRQQMETGADIVRMIQAAGAADAEIDRMHQDWGRHRIRGLTTVIRRISTRLRPELDVTTAVAIARSLTVAEVYQSLVLDMGWQPDEYERWLLGVLKQQLLL